jgi:hypothetical protein
MKLRTVLAAVRAEVAAADGQLTRPAMQMP